MPARIFSLNVCAAYSSIIAAAALQFSSDPKVVTEGYFHGFNSLTWLSITWQAAYLAPMSHE